MWERENQRGALGPNIAPATQRGPPLLHRIFPKSDPPYSGSASITLTWASVSTRSLSLGSGPLGHCKPVVPRVLDRRDCGVPLLHRTNEVGEVSGRRISEARGEGLLPRPGNLRCRSGKKCSFLLVGHKPEPLRKRMSSLDDWDSRGSSGQSKLRSQWHAVKLRQAQSRPEKVTPPGH